MAKFYEFDVTVRVKLVAIDPETSEDIYEEIEVDEARLAMDYVMGAAEDNPELLAGSGCFVRISDTSIVGVVAVPTAA